ncbi:MAG: sugar phosphate isomerase/epimerase [Fidelibacterota bacterium]|nr:MAG: sugar phosphate isomerase/epimerase [Candidatus Neomarinimicrobiota bacterium]
MGIEPLQDYSRLCIHTMTTRPWAVEEAVAKYVAAGVGGITIWREALEGRSPEAVGRMARDAGLTIVSLCRGGFFAHSREEARRQAIDENRRAIDEAAALETPLLVIVCGADPDQSLETSRKQIRDGLGAILPQAEEAGVRLGIEPLHPMYADDRSAITTLKQANDMCAELQSDLVGVIVDVYHLWWDPDLEGEIRRAGREGSLAAFHICDWKTPTTDLLLDRGLMGEGCIPIRTIRGWVEDNGFTGFHEVEIFSKTYWESDQDEFLRQIMAAYLNHS